MYTLTIVGFTPLWLLAGYIGHCLCRVARRGKPSSVNLPFHLLCGPLGLLVEVFIHVRFKLVDL